jgi:hypothetical protein
VDVEKENKENVIACISEGEEKTDANKYITDGQSSIVKLQAVICNVDKMVCEERIHSERSIDGKDIHDDVSLVVDGSVDRNDEDAEYNGIITSMKAQKSRFDPILDARMYIDYDGVHVLRECQLVGGDWVGGFMTLYDASTNEQQKALYHNALMGMKRANKERDEVQRSCAMHNPKRTKCGDAPCKHHCKRMNCLARNLILNVHAVQKRCLEEIEEELYVASRGTRKRIREEIDLQATVLYNTYVDSYSALRNMAMKQVQEHRDAGYES